MFTYLFSPIINLPPNLSQWLYDAGGLVRSGAWHGGHLRGQAWGPWGEETPVQEGMLVLYQEG